MRTCLFQSILGVILLASVQAPAQSVSDYRRIFTRAEQVQEQALPKQGRYSCEQDFAVSLPGEEGHGSRIKTFGRSIEEARTDLWAVCVKRKCGSSGAMMSVEMELMKAMSPEAFNTYLKALGKTDAEIAVIYKKLHSTTSSYSHVKCEDVGLEYLFQFANICLATPISCR